MIFSKDKSTHGNSILIEEHELFSDLSEKSGTCLFLGKYSMNALLAVLRKRSFFKDAQKRGLWPLEFDLDSSEFPPLQRLRVYHKAQKPENLMVDLKLKESKYKIMDKIDLDFPLPDFTLLALEWLTLQNPLLLFGQGRTPLPGQKHPGLNLGKKVVDLFIHLAKTNKNDGILAFPAYYHNALLFSRYFHFINPEKKAEMVTILKTFHRIPFKEMAWIVHLGCLKKENGEPYEWKAEELVFPLNKMVLRYLHSKQYREIFRSFLSHEQYVIDWDCYKKRLNKALIFPD